MKVSFYCGCYKSFASLIDEPDDCGAEGKVEVDEDNWREGCVCIDCPVCGAELHQSMDHFEVLENANLEQ